MRTGVRSILQSRVRDETDCGTETFRVPETIHHHVDLVTSQLVLDTLQCTLQAQPEVDLLRRGSGANIASELGDGLDRLDPLIDMALKGVEEGAVVEGLGWDVNDAGS